MTQLSIRIDLANGKRIGPGKVALLEAIGKVGSISGAARSLDMSYRRAWLLVDELNGSLSAPAVAAATGGQHGGGATLTQTGEQIISLYRAIEDHARASSNSEFRTIEKLVRKKAKADN